MRAFRLASRRLTGGLSGVKAPRGDVLGRVLLILSLRGATRRCGERGKHTSEAADEASKMDSAEGSASNLPAQGRSSPYIGTQSPCRGHGKVLRMGGG